MGISLRVLTHPDLENLPKIHREVGPDFRDRVLPSLGNEIMKAVVAQYNAEQLLTEREKVSQRISELLEERAERLVLTRDGRDPETIELRQTGGGYFHELVEVAECVAAGRTEGAVMPLDDTLAVMRVLETALHSFGLAFDEDPSPLR